MTYKEEVRDLFSVPEDYYLAHCISADFALGKGIAVEFNRRFDMKAKLMEYHPGFHFNKGTCLKIGRVFNLVTKERYFQKPTYQTLEDALSVMALMCILYKIKKIAMPMIGAGLDRLNWERVSEIIQDVFQNTDVEILVCRLENDK